MILFKIEIYFCAKLKLYRFEKAYNIDCISITN